METLLILALMFIGSQLQQIKLDGVKISAKKCLKRKIGLSLYKFLQKKFSYLF